MEQGTLTDPIAFLTKDADEHEMDSKTMYRAPTLFRSDYGAVAVHEFRIRNELYHKIR
jgi:hypothetical protein